MRRRYNPLKSISIGHPEGEKFGDGSKTPLTLIRRQIEVEFAEDFVQVTNYLTFLNSHTSALEGTLDFPLEEGTTISGFGLDVEGEVIDAVPVTKEKAKIIFEEKVRERDGNVAMVEENAVGNSYSMKIYPMKPNVERTTKLVYTSELTRITDGSRKFWLPCDVADSLKDMQIWINCEVDVEVQLQKVEDNMKLGSKSSVSFDEIKSIAGMEVEKKRIEGLVFSFAGYSSSETVVYAEKHPTLGYHYFYFNVEKPKASDGSGWTEVKEVKVVLYYDCSFGRSLNKTNLESERNVVVKILKNFESVKCTIVPFSETTRKEIECNSPDEVETGLKDVCFDGATAFPVKRDGSKFDFALFLSDGIFNFGQLDMKCFDLGCPCYTISASNQSNSIVLKHMADSSGAKFLNLKHETEDDLVKSFLEQSVFLQRIKADESEVKETYHSSTEGNVSVFGIMVGENCDVSLDFGFCQKKVKIELKKAIIAKSLVGKLFGKQKIQTLGVLAEENKEEITLVGLNFSIVTPGTTLIILEKLSDYIKYRVLPPISCKDFRKGYQNHIVDEKKTEGQRISEKIAKVRGDWKNRVQWYQKVFPFRDIVKEKVESVEKSLKSLIEGFDVKTDEFHRLKIEVVKSLKLLEGILGLISQKKRKKAIKFFEKHKDSFDLSRKNFHTFKKGILNKAEHLKRKVDDLGKRYDKYVSVGLFSEEVRKEYDELIPKVQEFQKSIHYHDLRTSADDFKFEEVEKKLKEHGEKELLLIGEALKELDKLREKDDKLRMSSEEKPSEKGGVRDAFKRFRKGDALRKKLNCKREKRDTKGRFLDQSKRSIRGRGRGRGRGSGRGASRGGRARSRGRGASRGGRARGRGRGRGGASRGRGRGGAFQGRKGNGKEMFSNQEQTDADGSIKVKGWESGTKYMIEIKKHENSVEKYKEYLKQRSQGYEASPSFFLDCGDFFLSIKEQELGIRILTSILELGLDDVQLLRIVGYRLQQEKNFELAKMIFSKVLKLAAHEPHSYRDLSLVFESLENYEEALKLMYKVITGKWDGRFNKIEQTALIEMNHILYKMGEEKSKKCLKELPQYDEIFSLYCPMDMRIVMGWDTDMTDIDLHVVDPIGEECYYGNKYTSTGGIYTHDFTLGYGPEEFLIKIAPKGIYKIKAKYYASHKQSLTGATTILLKFFTNYMRESEKSELITVRLDTNKEMIEVCDMEFN